MALTVPSTSIKLKKFNAIRRTPEGMLYLTTINPDSDSADIQFSN